MAAVQASVPPTAESISPPSSVTYRSGAAEKRDALSRTSALRVHPRADLRAVRRSTSAMGRETRIHPGALTYASKCRARDPSGAQPAAMPRSSTRTVASTCSVDSGRPSSAA